MFAPRMFTPKIAPLSDNEDCEFAQFFKQLGYRYSWDFSKYDGVHWHELYSKDVLVFQCDMDVPLERVVADIIVEEDFDCGYFIAGDHKTYPAFCNKVRDFVGLRWKTCKDRDKNLDALRKRLVLFRKQA